MCLVNFLLPVRRPCKAWLLSRKVQRSEAGHGTRCVGGYHCSTLYNDNWKANGLPWPSYFFANPLKAPSLLWWVDWLKKYVMGSLVSLHMCALMSLSEPHACGTWLSKQTWPPSRCKTVTDYPPISPICRPQGIQVWHGYEPQLLYYNCALCVCQHYFSCTSKVAVNDPS